jgi:tetratricopeptide (TPR) repeat protein
MLIIAFFLIGELCHTTGFIDIPTVTEYNIPGMLGGGLTFSMPLRGAADDPMDFTMVFRYGFSGRGELSLAMYTPTTYALSCSYVLKKEQGNSPAFYCGLDDISYNTHLSTIGMKGEEGFIEERNYHLVNNGRPWELFSAYFAMQKTMSVVNIVFGIGRGRFVGYAPRSHIFNTDLFIIGDDYRTEDHSAWAFGVFFGGSLRFPFGLEMIAEIDGRDGNAGLKYHHKYFSLTAALTKCEHFWSPDPYSPRLTFALETNNRFMLEGPKVGSIECVTRDYTSKTYLANYIVDIKELNKRYRAKGGTFSMSLPTGNYTITISKPNYEDYMAKITVKPGVKSKLIFNLTKTEEARQKEIAFHEKEQTIQSNLEKGKIYYSEGQLMEAKASFEKVLLIAPDNTEAKQYLGKIEPRRQELIGVYSAEARARVQAKDYTRAIEYWNKVLELDPGSSEARTSIANIQQKLTPVKAPPDKGTKPVVKQATKAEINALYNKGVGYFTSENYTQALAVFKQVLALDPNHAGAKDYKKRTEARLKVLKGGG